jgi:hypothetical protein
LDDDKPTTRTAVTQVKEAASVAASFHFRLVRLVDFSGRDRSFRTYVIKITSTIPQIVSRVFPTA